MSQTADEKSVQGIKDTADRKKAFYTKQRETAYAKGDTKTLDKISQKRGFKNEGDEFASKLKAKPMTPGDAANALGGDGDALGGLAKGVGRVIKGAASKFIPKFDAAATEASRAVGAKIVPPRRAALTGSKSTPKALPGGTKKALTTSNPQRPNLARSAKAVAKKAAPKVVSKVAGNEYADYDKELKRLQKKPRSKK